MLRRGYPDSGPQRQVQSHSLHRRSRKSHGLTVDAVSCYASAIRLNCYVFIGFPERVASAPDGAVEGSSRGESITDQYYNSLLIISPDGHLHTLYRKHFLYTTDESWAEAGPSFKMVELDFPIPSSSPLLQSLKSIAPDPPRKIRVCPAICMDLNPYRAEAPFSAFELATFAKANEVELVICLMNWLESSPLVSDPGSDDRASSEKGGAAWKDVIEYVTYWIQRLSPLITPILAPSSPYLVTCNRVGTEQGRSYHLDRGQTSR